VPPKKAVRAGFKTFTMDSKKKYLHLPADIFLFLSLF